MPPRYRDRIVFVLPGLERLPYHRSTIESLAGRGVPLTVVFCAARLKPYQAKDARLRQMLAYVDDLDARHETLDVIFESRAFHIRDYGPNGEYIKTLKANPAIWRLRSYARYLQRLPADNYYVRRWHGFLSERMRAWVDRPWARVLLKRAVVSRLLERLECAGRGDPGIQDWLRSVGAGVVVASPANSRRPVEADFLFAALKLGLPTAIPVLSWDNLSTKGLLPFRPSLVLAWNQEHAREARDIHGIAARRIVRTGSPFFDKWFDGDGLRAPRDGFMRGLGLDPARPVLLYLGSSQNIARNESWLVKDLVAALRADARLGDVQVLVRPHPANDSMIADLRDQPGVACLDSQVPFSDEALATLMNVLAHAFAVVGINTSGLVDAIVLDRPCFSIATDRYRDTHLEAAHFRHMTDARAIHVAPDMPDLI